MTKLTHSLGAKIGAVILWTIAMVGSVGGTIAIYCLKGLGFYGGTVYWPYTYEYYDGVEMQTPLYMGIYQFCWLFRYGLIAFAIVCGIAAVLILIFLFCSAGHRKDQEEVTANGIDRIPLDLFAAGIAAIGAVLISGMEATYRMVGFLGGIVITAIWLAVFSLLLLLCLMTLATRCKLGTLLTNTIIFRVLKFIGRIIAGIWGGIVEICRGLPLIWKTVLILITLSGIEFMVMALCWWETDVLVLWWVLEKIVLIPVILMMVLSMRKLQAGGRQLAEGHLDYRINTRHMFWDFRKHGENLNSISEGLNKAVDEKMKSERFKTELITNVSHDIKTPLTSIINYVDLIRKEEPENETMAEYIEVLDRQSKRLKKLIEDLVEASKASTGNISVEMQPTAVGVLLTQAAGEYDGRMNEKNLQLFLNQPEEDIMIMADGRHLWRVFDNLLSNICKYALSGTRVYLNLDRMSGKAVVTFRNISAYPLNLSADELMERFTRGDSSRHTEGSGLGLSIAKSLTELQKGEMNLYTDGDLFKVVLTFDQITAPAARPETKPGKEYRTAGENKPIKNPRPAKGNKAGKEDGLGGGDVSPEKTAEDKLSRETG